MLTGYPVGNATREWIRKDCVFGKDKVIQDLFI